MAIVNSWSLMTFARKYARVQVAPFRNSETGDAFSSIVCTKADGSRDFVRFSQNLGELTPAQISAQKDSLQVVELESGNYTLCKQGEPGQSWEDVDLGL